MDKINDEDYIRKYVNRYCPVGENKRKGLFTDYFYEKQQMFVGLVIDKLMTESSTVNNIFSINLRMRKICGYYICDAAIVEELFKRNFKVVINKYGVGCYFKFKDPRRLDKRIDKGEFDYFTDKCMKLFETEDDFKWIKQYARPGYDIACGLNLDQPTESCNL